MIRPIRSVLARWRPYGELLGAMLAESRWLTLALASTVVLRAVAPVGFVVAAATVVSRVPATVRDGLGSHAGHVLLVGIALMALAFLVQQVLPPAADQLSYALGNRLQLGLEQRLMRAVLTPPSIGHLEDPQLQNDVAAARQGLSGWPRVADAPRALAGRVSARISFIGAAALLLVFHWWIAVAVLVTGLWLQGQNVKSLFAAVQAQNQQAAAQRRSIYFRELALNPPAAKEIRVFGLGTWLSDRYWQSFGAALEVMNAERARGRRPLILATVAMTLTVAGTLLLLGWDAGGGHLELAKIAIVIQAVATAVQPVADELSVRDGLALAFTIQALGLATGASRRLAEIPVALQGTRAAEGLPQGEIRFEDVSFRYPGQDREVLKDLDLVVPAGRSLAIVGLNGAGKTTLMKLLCRLYEPTDGRITVDGIDLRDLDPAAWQRRIAAIFQDYVRYPLSAADNVVFGGLHRSSDRQLLDETARKVRATDVVTGLPERWTTTLSREYEGGVDLSGGEWQRIALARALFAAGAGASVLILDEPTASLDVRAEAEIYQQFLELTRGLTTLLISHRFSTVRHAQQICVLEGGRIVELGDHDSLHAAGGRYAELFTYQASRFGDAEEISEVAT